MHVLMHMYQSCVCYPVARYGSGLQHSRIASFRLTSLAMLSHTGQECGRVPSSSFHNISSQLFHAASVFQNISPSIVVFHSCTNRVSFQSFPGLACWEWEYYKLTIAQEAHVMI